MKIYKLITKSGTIIPIEGREALDALMDGINGGARLVMTKHGVVDASSIDSIVLHTKLMTEIVERARQIEGDTQKAQLEMLGDGGFAGEKTEKQNEYRKLLEKSGFGKPI